MNDLSVLLNDAHGIDITKESLHDRLNQSAVAFLKEALEKPLHKQLVVDTYVSNLEGIRGLTMMEKEVYLGTKAKLKTRLVIHRLPAEKVAKKA